MRKCKNCGGDIVMSPMHSAWHHVNKPLWVFDNWKSYQINPSLLPYAYGWQNHWCTPLYSGHCVAIPAESFEDVSELYDRLFHIQNKKPIADVTVELDSSAWIQFVKLNEVIGRKFTYTSKVYIYFDKIVYMLHVNGILVFEKEGAPSRFPDKEGLLEDINRELTLDMLENGTVGERT